MGRRAYALIAAALLGLLALGATVTYTAEVDPLGYLVGIDIVHHKIHEGDLFTYPLVDTDVDSGVM